MTEQEHSNMVTWIKMYKNRFGRYPSHKDIILSMLIRAKEITYIDGIEYGLGSTFRSRLSELRKQYHIISYDKQVPTRYGTTATVKAHKLGVKDEEVA